VRLVAMVSVPLALVCVIFYAGEQDGNRLSWGPAQGHC
jgi:hypothetical protein